MSYKHAEYNQPTVVFDVVFCSCYFYPFHVLCANDEESLFTFQQKQYCGLHACRKTFERTQTTISVRVYKNKKTAKVQARQRPREKKLTRERANVTKF